MTRQVFSPSSKGRLTERDAARFPEDTLFHRGRVPAAAARGVLTMPTKR